MTIVNCPKCGRDDMVALNEAHYFRCGACLAEWFILAWVPEPPEENWAMPLLESILGLEETSPEVAAFLKAQEGVPL